MQYQEIIDTIKVDDYVEIKGSLGLFDGVYVVDEVDKDDDDQTLLVDDFWIFNEYVVRKITQQELSTTNTQDSQNENDNSQCGNEIVVKAGEARDPEPPSCVKLQYDPRDVAFHRNTARWWLEKAIDIQKDRASEYDKEQERSASNVAKIFNILRDKNLTEADVFLILQILKQVRYCQNFDSPHEDSLLDNVSYASLFAEAVMRSKNTF